MMNNDKIKNLNVNGVNDEDNENFPDGGSGQDKLNSRAERMKLMRDKRRKAGEKRKEKIFQPVDTDLEINRVKRRALTKRGERYLQAGNVENKHVQDRSKNQVVVGSDEQVAEIIFNAIMETEVGFEGVNYQEGARYIVLNCTEQECRLGPLRRILPKRRFVNGTRPGVTGAGPMGANVETKNNGSFSQ